MTDVDSVGAAVRELAQPIATTDDLRALDAVVGDARVVLLGESAHGVPAFLNLRTRVFRYLATNLGFTALALEAGYPDLLDAADWVGGRGEAANRPPSKPDDPLAHGVGAGLCGELYDWMRSYNAAAARPVRLYGMDLASSGLSLRRPALTRALAFLDTVEPEYAGDQREAIQRLLDVVGDGLVETNSCGHAPLADRYELTARIEAIGSLLRSEQLVFAERTSREAAGRALWCAVIAARADAQLNASRAGRTEGFVRDAAMAETVLSILEREDRVLAYAHNLHIQRWPAKAGPWVQRAFTSFSQHLAASLPPGDVVVIGTTFGTGKLQTMAGLAAEPRLRSGEVISLTEMAALVPPEEVGPPAAGTADAIFASAKLDDFLFDLRRAPTTGPLADALRAAQTIRTNDFSTDAPLLRAFDAIIHLDHIEQVLPTPDTLDEVKARTLKPFRG